MGCGASHSAPVQKPRRPYPADEGSLQAAAAKVLRAHLLVEGGDYAEALQLLDSVVEPFPWVARAHLERGNAFFGMQQFKQACDCFSTALHCQGDYLHAHIRRAQAFMKLKQPQEALHDLDAALTIDPDNAEVQTLRQRVMQSGKAWRPLTLNIAQAADSGSSHTSVDPFEAGPDSPVAKLCMVCMEEARGCRLRPCMHACLCKRCATVMQSKRMGCPICSKPIESLEQGVFASTFAPAAFGNLSASPTQSNASPAADQSSNSPGASFESVRPAAVAAWS